QSWKAVSSPASHLRSASSRESPPDVEAPSQAAVPLDSPFIQADSPRSPAGAAESCFVPHTTHSPCGFTSPPQTRHTCSETVPTVGFTATGAAPSRASRARPPPMKIGGAHHPPRGYLIVRTALSYNNLDRAERTRTHPSKAVRITRFWNAIAACSGAVSGPMNPNTCQLTTVTVAARTIRVTLAAIQRSPPKAKIRLDVMIAASRRRHS